MAHTYCSSLFHCVFSTKGREDLLPIALQGELWAYIRGIARKNGFDTLKVGGTTNHCHVLLVLPPAIPLSKAIQLIKGGSSKWMKEKVRNFSWQEGYGAFSVSISHLNDTLRYIENQREHHKRRNFEEEFLQFLKRHNIDYDPKFVWG